MSIAITILPVNVIAVENAGDFLSRLRFQTDEGIDLIFFFADDLGGGIEGDARVALDIDHARDLDVGRALERITIAAQTVLHVVLIGHGKYHDVAFALQLLRQAQTSGHSDLIVIGTDEEKPLARGSVGIHGDDRNSSGDRLVDAVFEQRGIGNAEQNAGSFLLHRLIESIALGFGIVAVRADKIGAHFELPGSLCETRARGLPVGNLQIGRDEYEVLVGIMSGAATEQAQRRRNARARREDSLRKRSIGVLLRTANSRCRSSTACRSRRETHWRVDCNRAGRRKKASERRIALQAHA